MKVSFTLQRIDVRHPVSAALVPTTDLAEVLSLCERLPQWPKVYCTAEGYLLVLASGGRQPPDSRDTAENSPESGGLRPPLALALREISPHLLLPYDAELIPPLLPDEATGLVKHHGLIFLPGGKVLAYQPTEPLSPSALLGISKLERKPWQPLPEPPMLADQLREVRLEVPESPPEELLQAGNENIGSETPLAPSSSLASSLAGQASFGMGKFLAGVGTMLGWKGLANLGAKMMQGAMSLAPKLSEKLFGQQEAMLRRLLQAFKDGRIDDALRRALPLAGNDVVRGATPAQNAQLPFHNLFYSLSNLLGNSGGSGAGGLWLTQADVYSQLQSEYRNQAEAAERHGDFRRAAFIYGKLLSDFRSAVLVLSRGGLHHDAALLFLQKLNDPLGAAKEFEAAGEFDRALQLYRQQDDHERAGDLLKRMGEEEEALTAYKIAADMLIQRGRGPFQAGELLRLKAERSDLALPYYRSGWEHRPHDAAFSCASQLARYYTDTAAVSELFTLVEEAETFFAQPGHETAAANFFNELVHHANRPVLTEQKDNLRDRSLLALSSQIRRRIHSSMPKGQLVSMMLPASASWSPAQRSDAEHAVKAATKGIYKLKDEPLPAGSIKITARTQVVTAVAWDMKASALFVGFESGEIVCYRPLNGAIVEIADHSTGKVIAMATGEKGLYSLHLMHEITVAYGHAGMSTELTQYVLQPSGQFKVAAWRRFACHDTPCLFPANPSDLAIAVWTGKGMLLYSEDLTPSPIQTFRGLKQIHATLEGINTTLEGLPTIDEASDNQEHENLHGLSWRLGRLHESTLKQSLFHWCPPTIHRLFVAGIDDIGLIHLSEMDRDEGTYSHRRSHASFVEGYAAVCFLDMQVMAGVRKDAIHWFRYGGSGLHVKATTPSPFVNPIACFPLSATKELLVVCSDGTVGRVPFAV